MYVKQYSHADVIVSRIVCYLFFFFIVNFPELISNSKYYLKCSNLIFMTFARVSRVTAPSPRPPKVTANLIYYLFEILLVKRFSLKLKAYEILTATIEKIKFCLSKKPASYF